MNRRSILKSFLFAPFARFLPKPQATLVAAGPDAPTSILVDSETGISIRMIRSFDIRTRTFISRFDSTYGPMPIPSNAVVGFRSWSERYPASRLPE